jgi:hypothetical protein
MVSYNIQETKLTGLTRRLKDECELLRIIGVTVGNPCEFCRVQKPGRTIYLIQGETDSFGFEERFACDRHAARWDRAMEKAATLKVEEDLAKLKEQFGAEALEGKWFVSVLGNRDTVDEARICFNAVMAVEYRQRLQRILDRKGDYAYGETFRPYRGGEDDEVIRRQSEEWSRQWADHYGDQEDEDCDASHHIDFI